MEYVAVAGAVVTGYGQYQAGKFQRDMYNRQADEAEMQAKQRSLEYEQKAVNTLDETLRSVASINAYAGSANIDPFSGSVANLTTYALASGYKDFNTLQRGQQINKAMGSYQAGIYRASGKMAYQTGVFQAVGTAMGSAGQINSIGPSGGSTTGGGGGFSGSSSGYGGYSSYGSQAGSNAQMGVG